jgi:hypothetical protein
LEISQGEETITDLNLLEIKRSGVKSIQIVKSTKAEEAIKGIDWEWWIGSNTRGWLRYAMQAKKIQVASQRYDSLGHKVNGILQINLLETYARTVTAIPLYCLYNYPKNPISSQHWHCNFPYDEKQMGCTVTPLSIIRQAMNTKGCRNFNFIHTQNETIPWRCLLNCPRIMQIYTGAPTDISFENIKVYPKLPSNIARAIEEELPILSPESYPAIRVSELGDISESDIDYFAGKKEIRIVPRKVLVINTGSEFE